jgi:hypothetical protein
MKKNILFLFLLLFCYFAQAQTRNNPVEKAYVKKGNKAAQEAIAKKDVKILEDFVKTNPYPSMKTKAWFYTTRAGILTEMHDKMLRDTGNSSPQKILILKKIMGNYQAAIDSCQECIFYSKVERLAFLKEYKFEPSLLSKDLKELKTLGFKEEKDGIMLGLSLIKAKDTWIGGQLAFLSYNSPRYKIKINDPSTGKKKVMKSSNLTLAAQILPLSFHYNLQQHNTEFEASLFRFSAPIFADITKFGYRNQGKDVKGSAFYRPEIGLGFGYFSLSYGYNVWFNKSYRNIGEKHLLQLRFTPIFGK